MTSAFGANSGGWSLHLLGSAFHVEALNRVDSLCPAQKPPCFPGRPGVLPVIPFVLLMNFPKYIPSPSINQN